MKSHCLCEIRITCVFKNSFYQCAGILDCALFVDGICVLVSWSRCWRARSAGAGGGAPAWCWRSSGPARGRGGRGCAAAGRGRGRGGAWGRGWRGRGTWCRRSGRPRTAPPSDSCPTLNKNIHTDMWAIFDDVWLDDTYDRLLLLLAQYWAYKVTYSCLTLPFLFTFPWVSQ